MQTTNMGNTGGLEEEDKLDPFSTRREGIDDD